MTKSWQPSTHYITIGDIEEMCDGSFFFQNRINGHASPKRVFPTKKEAIAARKRAASAYRKLDHYSVSE